MENTKNFLKTCEHIEKLVEWLDANGRNLPGHPVEIWFADLPDARWQWLEFDDCHRIHCGDKFNIYYAEGVEIREDRKVKGLAILILDRETLWYSYITPNKFSSLPAIPISPGFKCQLVSPLPDLDDYMPSEN